MENAPTRLLLSPLTAARMLDCSRSSIYKMMKEGSLSFVLIGADRRIPFGEIERIAKSGSKAITK